MSNYLRVGVVGAGNWGKNLLRVFASLPDVDLAYVCDLNSGVLKHLSAQYPEASFTKDYRELVRSPDVDAVVVATNSPTHFEICREALLARNPVFCEKPLTTTSVEATELLGFADRFGLILMVGHLLEYHPAIEYMKEAIERGDLGVVRYVVSRRVNLGVVRTSENAWWSLAPHDVSVACCLLGDVPVRICVTGQCFLQPMIEDVVFATLWFPGGQLVHIHASWLDPDKVREITVVGDEKMVVFDDMSAAEKLRIYDKGVHVQTGVSSYAEAIAIRSGDILIPKLPLAEPLRLECEHFVRCVTTQRQPRSDGESGLRVVKILEAGQRSLANGSKPEEIKW